MANGSDENHEPNGREVMVCFQVSEGRPTEKISRLGDQDDNNFDMTI